MHSQGAIVPSRKSAHHWLTRSGITFPMKLGFPQPCDHCRRLTKSGAYFVFTVAYGTYITGPSLEGVSPSLSAVLCPQPAKKTQVRLRSGHRWGPSGSTECAQSRWRFRPPPRKGTDSWYKTLNCSCGVLY